MSDIRTVTPEFAVAPQLAPEDMSEAVRRGYVLVVNNRPDGEALGQPTTAEMARAAAAAGLGYLHIPVRGAPTAEQVAAMRAAVDGASGAVLAFCRSGTRSITAWSLGEAARGERTRQSLIDLAGAAGYDLSGALS